MNNTPSNPNEEAPISGSRAAERRFMVSGQFVRDLSFENPDAPNSLFQLKKQPEIGLDFQLRVQQLQKSSRTFDVTLELHTNATVDDKVLFVVELAYTGIAVVNLEIPESEMKRVLFHEVPQYLYPFARRVIADATRDGGFPPLLLDPLDFNSLEINDLYKHKSKDAGESSAA